MEFKVSKISGLDDAIISLFMSKRNYTSRLENYIRELVADNTDRNGFYKPSDNKKFNTDFLDYVNKLAKYGIVHGHETLLRFIDITVVTTGLHRGGMDDLDSHAHRMNNRIVRSSTRLARFNGGEKSEWYQNKIKSFEEVFKESGIDIPEIFIDENGDKWVKRPFGYVLAEFAEDNDVLRGNYPLSIPMDAIWKCNYVDLRHIYKMRNIYTHAHPELKLGIEQLYLSLSHKLPVLGDLLGKDYYVDKNGKVHFVHISKIVKTLK